MLANLKPAAATPVVLYTNAGSARVTVTLNAANLDRTNNAEVTVCLLTNAALPTGTNALDPYTVEPAVVLGPAGSGGNSPLRDDFVLLAGQSIAVMSSTGTVTFTLWGIV